MYIYRNPVRTIVASDAETHESAVGLNRQTQTTHRNPRREPGHSTPLKLPGLFVMGAASVYVANLRDYVSFIEAELSHVSSWS